MNIDDSFEPSPRGKQKGRIRPRSIVGRLAGRWWQILFIWLMLSTPVILLIYSLIEPTFEAFSLLQVEPTQPQLFGPLHPGIDLAQPYVQTQVQLMTSDKVLDAAISRDPRLARLPMIQHSKDAKADLRKAIKVEIVDNNTYLIRVSLLSPSPEEPAEIVNAVVASYLEQHGEYHRSANKVLHNMLDTEIRKLTNEIEAKKAELSNLVQEGRVEFTKPQLNPDAAKDEAVVIPSVRSVTPEQYTMLADQLIQADLALIDAQVRLEVAKVGGQGGEKVRDLEAAVEEARKRRSGYAQYMENVTAETKPTKSDTFKASILKQELDAKFRMQEIIVQKLEQLNFEDKQDVFRISLHDIAGVPRVPADNKRIRLMATAPWVILMLIVGMFLLIEIRATPISDRY